MVSRLARRAGATVEPPTIRTVPEPSLFELAQENAVEGQVGETFGALLAVCQAHSATDPEIRASSTQIARDETAHADLAYRLARWLDPQLTLEQRAAVRAARDGAIAALRFEDGLSAHDRRWLGIPDPAALQAAATAMFASLA
jgi:hypothetical protein